MPIARSVFLRRWWPFLVAFAMLAGFLFWLHQRDERIRREVQREVQLAMRDAIIEARADSAAARIAERRVDSVTVVQRLALVRRDTLWRSDTVYVAGDTTPRYAVPIGTIAQHDSAFAACDRLNHSCAAEPAAASLVILELMPSLALARTGYAASPPERRWSLGVTAGWGALATRDSGRTVLRTGPSITAGGSFRVF